MERKHEYKPALLLRHPWVALLGFLPPVYLVGLIRTWGGSEYRPVWIDLGSLALTGPGWFWWPIRLFNRKRREKKSMRTFS